MHTSKQICKQKFKQVNKYVNKQKMRKILDNQQAKELRDKITN